MKNLKYTNSYSSDNTRLISNPLLPEDAQRAVRLVEERGVAGCPYKKEIDAIVQWLADATRDFFSQEPNAVAFNIKIPEKLTKKIDFVPITITAEICRGDMSDTGGGDINIEASNNRQITACNISLSGNCNSNGVLIRKTVLGTLYHEINHLYETYYSLAKQNPYRLNKSMQIANIRIKDSTINSICYRLFSESERSALIASVYGDLEGMDSERINFAQDITQTQAYQVYENIEKNYRQSVDNLSPNDGLLLYYQMNDAGVKFKVPIHNLNDFKKALKQKIAFCLKKLIKNIGRAASLWYDRKEVEKIRNLSTFSFEHHPII